MSIAACFLQRSRYYLVTEYPAMIRTRWRRFLPAELWWRPNEHRNSMGNLLLHLSATCASGS